MSNHPITPPPDLVNKWHQEYLDLYSSGDSITRSIYVATQSAQWGADQELEACCELVPGLTNYLRAARRPQPLSDKEQALNALSLIMSRQKGMFDGKPFNTIRKVLEQLND